MMNEGYPHSLVSVGVSVLIIYHSSFIISLSRFFPPFEEALDGFERVPLVVGGEVGL